MIHARRRKSSRGPHPATNCCGKRLRHGNRSRGRRSKMRNAGEERAASAQFVEEGGHRVGCLITLRDTSWRAEFQDQIDVTPNWRPWGG